MKDKEEDVDDLKWCYFCNSKEHSGLHCEAQEKAAVIENLNPEMRQKWSRGRVGALEVGDVAPQVRLLGLENNVYIELLSQTSGDVPLVLTFGSYT